MKLVSLVALKLVESLDNAAGSPALLSVILRNRRGLIAMIDLLGLVRACRVPGGSQNITCVFSNPTEIR